MCLAQLIVWACPGPPPVSLPQLIVFHDALLSAAFPTDGANAGTAAKLEVATGTPFQLLTAQDLTLAQLQALHLAGRPGLCIPTLQQYLE